LADSRVLLEILVCKSLLQKFFILRGFLPQPEIMSIRLRAAWTSDQNLHLQMQAPQKKRCKTIFREKLSGASPERPEFQRMLDQLRTANQEDRICAR
jgi:Resolvase, N terminal domain